MIIANEYIQTGFSMEDAEKLLAVIEPLVKQKENLTIDFTGIKLFTTLFFNNVLAKFVMELGPDCYNEKFFVKNLSEVGETTYQHSLENAKDYFAMTPEKRAIQNDILEDPTEE